MKHGLNISLLQHHHLWFYADFFWYQVLTRVTHQSLLSLLFVGFFVENMACTRLAALCVGIEEYQYDIEECQHGDVPHGLHHLPNASRDANNFSREMLRRGFRDNNLFLLVGHVSQQKLKEGILKFLKYAEDNISREGVQLLVVFIAAHGKQPQGSELPVILASDYENEIHSVLDLDTLLLKPLDSMQGGKIKALFVLDTCRENTCIQTWTGHDQRSLKRSRQCSETDFQILLACDRGRVASDADSLTAAFLCALRSPQSDLEVACKQAQTSIEVHSSGTQRPWRYCHSDFSGIFLPDEERPCMRLPLAVLTWLVRGTGGLFAAIVVLLWGLLESGITWSRIDQSGPEIIEVILDTCVFCMSLTRLAHSLRGEEESTCSEPASHSPVVAVQNQHKLFTTKGITNAGRGG